MFKGTLDRLNGITEGISTKLTNVVNSLTGIGTSVSGIKEQFENGTAKVTATIEPQLPATHTLNVPVQTLGEGTLEIEASHPYLEVSVNSVGIVRVAVEVKHGTDKWDMVDAWFANNQPHMVRLGGYTDIRIRAREMFVFSDSPHEPSVLFAREVA